MHNQNAMSYQKVVMFTTSSNRVNYIFSEKLRRVLADRQTFE